MENILMVMTNMADSRKVGLLMSFSSPVFLFVYMPITVLLVYIVRDELRNVLLLGISMFFYWYWQGNFLMPLIGSIGLNYMIGILIENYRDKKIVCKAVFILGVTGNVIMLYVFKYANFTIDIINHIGKRSIHALNLILPIGLSFFTFKAISYLADIYMGKNSAEKNPVNFALYISFSPRLCRDL